MRLLMALSICAFSLLTYGQPSDAKGAGQWVLTEEVGLPMNKAQVMAAAQEAWAASFGAEPGGQMTLVDPENGLLEGMARMNYRSTLLAGREETMGAMKYHVSIQAKNGQCHVRVHTLQHTGNRSAKGGGINMGVVMEGIAPNEHYPGMSPGASRRMHGDLRTAAAARLQEVMRKFSARIRLLGAP